jgi:glycerol uptake facilitator-like aquaporin
MLRERTKIAMLMAEFLGTAILTIVALTVVHMNGSPYFVGLAAGLTIAALTLVLGPASGAHFNPAVTLGMLSARKGKAPAAILYVAMQLLGGILAYVLYAYLINMKGSIQNTSHFDSRALVAEAVGAFVFTMGWAATVYHRLDGGRAAFVVGGSLALGIIIASAGGTGIINPAVALGLRSWAWGSYVLGPILGGVIGFNLYALLFAPAQSLVEGKKK